MRFVKITVNSKNNLKQSNAPKRPGAGTIVIGVIIAIFAVVILRGFSNDQHQKAVYQAAHPTPPPGGWSKRDGKHLYTLLMKMFAPALANSGLYSLAVFDTRGDVIFDDAANTAVVPASVLKLVVADSTLNDFGADYRFTTSFMGAHPIQQDGTLDGNLWFVPSGDPSLR